MQLSQLTFWNFFLTLGEVYVIKFDSAFQTVIGFVQVIWFSSTKVTKLVLLKYQGETLIMIIGVQNLSKLKK